MLIWTGVATAGWLQDWRFSTLCFLDLPRLLATALALLVLTPSQGWVIAACLWVGGSLGLILWELISSYDAPAVEA